MSKELIRNGGFERGDTEFWESEDVLSIEALAAAKKYGIYGCKVISDGSVSGKLQIKDFIPISYKELLNLSLWIKNSTIHNIIIRINEYDCDKQYMGYLDIISKTVGTVFDFLNDIYLCRIGVSYIKISIIQDSFSLNNYSYIDSVLLKAINIFDLFADSEELINITNETIKHTVNGPEYFTGIWTEAEYFFDLTSFTETVGANPVTIDVKIESYDPETDTWRDAMVFQQKSCPASGSVTTQEYKRLVGGLGWKQRVVYTTAGAGTIGDCDFKVGVVYKR